MMTNTLPDSTPSGVAHRPDPWETVKEVYRAGDVVTGTVQHLTDYGAFVNLSPGIQGLVHISELSRETDKLPFELLSLGQKLEVRILRVQPAQRKIRLALKQLDDVWETVETKYAVGRKIKGKVVCLPHNGVRVEIEPGVTGLVRATEISWASQKPRPADVFTLGQEISALVLGINCPKQKISLSIRQLEPDPWDKVEANYPVGTRVKGAVYKLTTKVAFVEIAEGISGLVHISDLPWLKRSGHPAECLKKGDEIEAVVLKVNQPKRCLTLGIRQFNPDSSETVAAKYPIGSRVKGTVYNLTAYGAFVEIADGTSGMVHISNLSWLKKIKRPAECLKTGDEIEAVVLEVDLTKHRLALGIKQLDSDPWEMVDQLYKVGDDVTGKVVKLVKYGAFVELESGLHGLVHISRISEPPVAKVEDVLAVGQTVSAHIMKIDLAEKRIGLSMLEMKEGFLATLCNHLVGQ